MEAVLAFGLNNQGQLGLHQDERNESTPVLVREFNQTGRSVVHISASLVHSVLLDSSGVVYTCGGNDRNQLGRDRRKRTHFRAVDAIESRKILQVAAGNAFTCTCSQNSRLFSWGSNGHAQLGIGDRESHARPKAGSAAFNVVQLEAGAEHTIGLAVSGHVVVFGMGSSGQMGNGQFTSLSSPTPVPALVHRPVVQIAAGHGGNFCLALTVGGNLYGW
jgi:alpha-tubulin suppressor-like RCC1 family protein